MATTTNPPRPAIPTFYRGITFRSKLEARWAFVLKRLEVPWEYEPEARRTKRGGYLPDFYLPKMQGGTWLEVKPFDSLGMEDPRWTEFALQRGQRLVAVFGLRDPYEGAGPERSGVGLCIYASGEIDYEYQLTACAVCGEVGFEFAGRGARACSDRKRCYGRLDADRANNTDDDKILAALVEARGQFCGAPITRPGRTLTDAEVDGLAQIGFIQQTQPGGIGRWLNDNKLSTADREAVLLAWGRLQE